MADREAAAPASFRLLIAVALAAAIVFPLSAALCGMQDSDGILTAFISTQKLTWYFWDQDRFLNFIPALAHPISDVVWNLRFQLFLRCLFAFLAPLGFLCFLTRSPRTLTIATVLANGVLALSLNREGLFNLYIQHNPFGTSLVLLAAAYAFVACHRDGGIWRWAVAAVLLLLAYATNVALLAVSLPMLVVVLCFDAAQRKRLLAFIVLNIVAIVLANLHARHFGDASTKLSIAPSLQAMLAGYDTVRTHLRWVWVAAFVLASLVAGLAARARHRWAAILLVAGCMALIGVLSCAEWAQINGYNIRYYLTFLIGIVASSGYLLVSYVRKAFPWLENYSAATAWALLVLALMGGLHGLSATPRALVASDVSQSSEAIATAAVQENAQLVVGGFWDAWPVVFEANALLQAQGRAATVYGGAQRGYPLRNTLWALAKSDASLRALCFLNSAEACAYTASNGLKAHMVAVPRSERRLSVAGRSMLLLELRFAYAGPDLPSLATWGQAPLNADLVHAALTADPIRFDPEHDQVIVPLAFRNEGRVTLTPYGNHAVLLGAKLTDEAGNVLVLDYARAPLPPSEPGEQVRSEFELAAHGLEGHAVSILPLQEGIAWFDQFGVAPIVEGPFQRCSKDGKPWLCEAGHPLDAR